jgi:hypothetical protein
MAPPLTPSPISCHSFSVFYVLLVELTDGEGVGEELNTTARKPGPLKLFNTLWGTLLYTTQSDIVKHSTVNSRCTMRRCQRWGGSSCIESCLPIGWRTFIWWKYPPRCCSILVRIAECWNSLLTSHNPKNNWCLSRIFEARFERMQTVIQTSRRLDSFLHEAA